MKTDLEIIRSIKPKNILKIAKDLGLKEKEIELYGDYKAKVKLEVLQRLTTKPLAKYIDVTAITPTPLGEGKTVITIGLSLGLNRLGKRAVCCLRQPSLGPVFGIKGGAAGGGYSQIIPMEDFNLHLTGDTHAVSLSHNLCAAYLENAIFRNKLNIDLDNVLWRRVVDVSDRSLRNIRIGLGSEDDGIPRESGFDISAASEVMAILALTSDLADLRRRLGRIIVAFDKSGKPVTAEDLKVAGAMAVLLKDAVKPNLLQTTENTPCLVHAGPFANIAHGNSSILADKIALRLAEFVVTESGFGADCGAEKFFDIKCRISGLIPDCVVLVCTVRALKMHSGRFKVVAGKPLDKNLIKEDIDSLKEGTSNLIKQLQNLRQFGLPVVVAINRFDTDSDKEIDLIKRVAVDGGAFGCSVSEAWAKGGEGARELAKIVVGACGKKNNFNFLYPLNLPIKEKIKIIATRIYGAREVEYSEVAERRIKQYTEMGFADLPICMAKTHLSLSHDPQLKGAPKDFLLPVRDIRLASGAGFLYPLCGKMQTMPGLPSCPVGEEIDIDAEGNIIGLS